MKKRKQQKSQKIKPFAFVFCLVPVALMLFISICGIKMFKNEHYTYNTFINGVDCSWLSVKEAKEKINSHLRSQSISFIFPEENYTFPASTVDLKLTDTYELETILENQRNGSKIRDYQLESALFVDTDKLLKDVFHNIDSVKEENMKTPKSAYLTLTKDNFFEIVPEEIGYLIDFDQAYLLASDCLRLGKTTIDFSELIISQPNIFSSDETLISEKQRINCILSTVVNITLTNGTTITLDNSVMKDWIVQNDTGGYDIDIDSNLPKFVSSLSQKVKGIRSYVEFPGTNIGNISMPYRMYLDVTKESETLKSELLTGGTYERSANYSKSLNFEDIQNYVELDLSRQTIWMYHNGKCIVESPCVTGDVSGGHSTPTGLFYLSYKTTDTYLTGYNNDGSRYKSHVNYWMPFNGHIGLHDAAWRNKFGGTIYKTNGSHGCVNLPFKTAKIIYEHIDSTMPIIVYSSEGK